MAEITYTHGFYRELTPNLLSFAALVAGYRAPAADAPLTYCELGCGHGVSTNIFAAANPHIQFHATDFNPAQIAGARELAAAAGLRNVHFHERSFAEFVEMEELPDFDIIALHGIYSWISAENRAHIVEFIRRRLKPGGFVYISYNTLPGWAAAAPLRRLMYDAAADSSGPILGKVDQALAFVEQMSAAGARYFLANPSIKERAEKLKGQPRPYLAHEYFNSHWTTFYHGDVAAELAEAKLNFVASAALLEQIDAINLTPDQIKLLGQVADSPRRETLRDFMVNQQFRRDIFVRGKQPLRPAEAGMAWDRLHFTLSIRRGDVPMKVNAGLGEANLQPDIYNPILDRLADGVLSWPELVATPMVAALGVPRVMQAMTILVGAGHVQLALPPAGLAQRQPQADAFNGALLQRARYSGDITFMVSPVTGGGIVVDQIGQLFLLAAREGAADPALFALQALTRNNQRVLKDGKVLQTEQENLDDLRSRLATFDEKQRPVLERLGIR